MDYLDPEKKRAHKFRILIGYGLFAIAISFATLVLVYLANGYYIDRSTGELIRNGLVFIDSKPSNAEIYMNGERQRGRTDARLVMPSGSYTFELKRNGYRPWTNTIQLEGGSLRRLTYARLIPEQLDTLSNVNLPAEPASVAQSIDKRWLVMSYPANVAELSLLDLNQAIPVLETLVLPAGIVTQAGGSFEIVDWADDNATFIISYRADELTEYILVNRENPANSLNLSILFANPQFDIKFQDRKRDRFQVFNPVNRQLYRATLSNGVELEPIISQSLIDYKSYGTNWVLYLVENEEEGFIDARLRRGSQDILLRSLREDSKYLLELAKLGNVPVVAISSPVENRVAVYYDPEKYLADNPEARIPVATTILQVKSPQKLSISSDSSVVLAYGPTNFASHEFESDRSYNFKLAASIEFNNGNRWMDGQHYTFISQNKQYMADFNGSNMYELVNSSPNLGLIFNESINTMYSFAPASAADDTTPEIPARLKITSLLTPNDR